MEPERSTILVVDDDQVIRRLFQYHLQAAGYDVHEAGDGLEAIQLMRQHRYALVITDQQMPRLTGLDLLAILQRLDDPTPVILVSSYLDDELSNQALQYGAAVAVPKPTNRSEILDMICRVVPKPLQGAA
jgi:CheY-like chemotaxis protein